MHVARGGWLGQTYALAKFDDSFEGKKSGIRRSKEERKGMVETFIKRYQKLNNGDFPSLNLTRKEVGGSFYTVREIVREIIQENRVLGPPKSPPGDENMENLDSFLEQYPLGSLCTGDEEIIYVETSQISGGGVGEQKDELVASQTQKHQILENLEIGNSRLGPATVTIHNLDEKSSEREVVNGDFEEKDTEDNKHFVCNEMHLFDNLTDVVDIKLEEEMSHTLTESKPTLVLDVNGKTDVKLEGILLAEEKIVNGAIGQNLHSKTSCSSVQQPTHGERSANLNKSSEQPGGNSQKRTNATLNRINLESWKAASKKYNSRETNQLVKFIKSFITAFVKFWSE